MVDVECQELLPEIELLATVADTFVILVDLKQEKHVILVNFVIALVCPEELVDGGLNVCLFLDELGRSTFGAFRHLCFIRLVSVEIALEQTMMQVDFG